MLVGEPGVEGLGRIVGSHSIDRDVPGGAVAGEELVELAVVETAARGIIPVRRVHDTIDPRWAALADFSPAQPDEPTKE